MAKYYFVDFEMITSKLFGLPKLIFGFGYPKMILGFRKLLDCFDGHFNVFLKQA